MPKRPYLISAENFQRAKMMAELHSLEPGEWEFIPEFPLPVRKEHLAGRIVSGPEYLIGSFLKGEVEYLTRPAL